MKKTTKALLFTGLSLAVGLIFLAIGKQEILEGMKAVEQNLQGK